MGVGSSAARSLRALTIASWIAAALAFGATGCATSVRVNPGRSAEFVEEYSKTRDSVLVLEGRRYRVHPENEIELRADSVACVDWGAFPPPPGGPKADGRWGTRAERGTCDESFSARLEDLRARERTLYFPGGRRVTVDELESVELVVHGEKLRRLERKGTQPFGEGATSLGLQIGSTAYFQFIVRQRIVGPLYLEGGGLVWGQPPLMNGSVGVVLDVPVIGGLSTYLGTGGGFGFLIGEGTDPDCPPDEKNCPVVAGQVATYFLHCRLGLAYRVGLERRDLFGIDGGFWSGGLESDDGGKAGASTRRILWPMAGVTFLHEL